MGIRDEYEEQLKHEMLSMLPTEQGTKSRVGGLMICQSAVYFYAVEKRDDCIKISEIESFKLTVFEEFKGFINYMVGLFNWTREL